MRGEPPQRLTSLLDELGLATPDQVRGIQTKVRRLAAEFPDFESVWVDALAQARVITPYQAAELNAGRGELLACDEYVITQPLQSGAFAHRFAAKHRDTGRDVRLYLARRMQGNEARVDSALADLVSRSVALRRSYRGSVEAAARRGDAVWAVCEPLRGVPASEWMAENGRLPPDAVLSIAREMLDLLAQLEQHSIVHGDLGASMLLFLDSGGVALAMPGLRGAVRPGEGYSFNDLPSEAYDYLSPERIGRGCAPTFASDVYACGCLWWQLLTGRTPFGGGNSLSKLKAAHAARWVDVRQFAPQTPESLAMAISRCSAREPAARPQNVAELGSLLGTASRGDGRTVALALRQTPWHAKSARREARPLKRTAQLATACCLAAFVVVLAVRGNWFTTRVATPIARNKAATASDALSNEDQTVPVTSATQARASHSPLRYDDQVAPAAATDPAPHEIELLASRRMVLSSSKPNDVNDLALSPGVTVCGAEGERATVTMHGRGMLIDCDDVSFENIDFVWQASTEEPTTNAQTPSMFTLRAKVISWRGCTIDGRRAGVTAISAPGASDDLALGVTPELSIDDTVVRGVAAVVEGAVMLRLGNSLCVASGPLVRIPRGGGRGEPLTISLDHATLRGDGAVLEWRYGRQPSPASSVTISANECVFDIGAQGGLLLFGGGQRPEQLLRSITWNGQGSLVTPQTTIAAWRNGDKQPQALADDALEIAGLVHSALEFAGKPEGPPAASRVTRWQGPLRSAEPPGINPASLPLVRKDRP